MTKSEERREIARDFMKALLCRGQSHPHETLSAVARRAFAAADAFLEVAGPGTAEPAPDPTDQVCECGQPVAFGLDCCDQCMVEDTIRRA